MKKKKKNKKGTVNPVIMIGTPMFGGQCFGEFAKCREQANILLSRHGYGVAVCQMTNESLITRGRNSVTHVFLKSRADYLMFIDADVGFRPESVIQLVQTGKDIIGGSYPLKAIDPKRIIDAYNRGVKVERLLNYASKCVVHMKHNGRLEVDIAQPLEVDLLGTGFMLIHRRVFEAMIKADPGDCYIDPNQGGERVYNFFKTPLIRELETLYSEDYAFCHDAQKLGFKIWLAPWIQLSHTGTMTFRGDFLTSNHGVYQEDLDPERVKK